MRVLFVLLVAASIAGSSTAQIAKSGSGYLFRAKYARGQKMSYGMAMSMPSLGGAGGTKVNSPLVMTVRSVNKGVATVDVATGPVTMNGKSQGAKEVQTVQIDSRNRAVGGKAGFEAMASFAFPEKPISVGSKWSGDMDLATPMAGKVKMKATYTFVGVKTVKGKPVAEVKTSFTGNAMGKITGGGTTLLLLSDGSLYNASAKVKVEIQMDKNSAPMEIVTTVALTRK